jgi:hypothetical protein
MPYLNFETYQNQLLMREAVESVIDKGHRTTPKAWLPSFTTSTESLTDDDPESSPRTSQHGVRYSSASSSQQSSRRITDRGYGRTHECSNDEKLISAYLSKNDDDPKLHVRRTLDQYYYHMLKDTKARDNDQVVYRWAKLAKLVQKIPDPKVLMVDQLWLWIVDGSKS